jgi:hypothetical protein
MKIPAPANPRQTFELFHLYRAEAGLASLIDRLDWSGVSRAQVFGAVMGRLPENRNVAIPGNNYVPKTHFGNALNSQEFQRNVIRNFLTAYPEKTRHLFVHVPKCAGTDLETDIARRSPALGQSLQDRGETPLADLHAALARLSSEVIRADRIFVFGHFTLRWYLEQGLYRFGDRLFTVVREPIGIILSLVNYILTVIVNDQGITRNDTANWLAALKLSAIPPGLPQPEMAALGRRVLQMPALVQRNYICEFLGTGTAASTLDPLAVSNIEVVDISRYTAWRQHAMGIGEGLHQNPATRFLTAADLMPIDREYIDYLTEEDRRFYTWITRLLAQSTALSFRGIDIVREEMRG